MDLFGSINIFFYLIYKLKINYENYINNGATRRR